MTVTPKSLLAASSVVVCSLLAASCGVAANDVAATYRDSEISTATVDSLVGDEAMSQLVGFTFGESDTVLSGSSARSVLDFLLQGEALIDLAEELGYTVEADESLLEQTLASFQQQGFAFGADDLTEEARDFLGRFVVADQALVQGGVELGEPSEAELRFAYDETAESGRWDRTCVTLVAALPPDGPGLAEAFEDGLALTEATTVAPDAQVALDPSVACATGADFAQLPEDLAAEIQATEAGVLVGPLEVDAGTGQVLAVFFEVESRQTVDFDAAREELEAEVAQSLLSVRIARESEINPRYGTGPVLVPGNAQGGGASLVARVERPEAPEASADIAIPAP